MSKLPALDFWNRLQTSQLVRWLLLIALGWAITQVLAYFEAVLVIFIFAAIFAFLLNYPVQWVARFVPRGLAVIVVFLLSLLLLGGLVVTLGSVIVYQVQQLLTNSPQLIETLIGLFERLQILLARWNLEVDFSGWEEQIRGWGLEILEINFTFLQDLLFNLIDGILIAVITFFMLLDGRRLWRLILRVFPPSKRTKITAAIQSNFLGFFWGRLLLSVFFGISTFIVFVILGVPFAITLAAIAAMFDLIPGIGATIGVSLVSIVLLPQGLWLSLKALIICIILQQIEENLLMPRIMQGSIDMNPVVMFLALLIGARVAGLAGIFLSIPIAGVLINLFELQECKGERTQPRSA
ncbi:AI-2E family transporter [Acaryochloris sp. CCMEE 5410]|uniref:AI-2E family transporter n=1 Tax=Acaryochloris sp. CCMEE 5410 TaxID=310037 RepID=UPI0002484ED6|nr:AI-2E family transporter [Acaryochloris sp. CCMEE 5410]KAI9132301.1 AI-2E family transporter [Acaryochloris sp. CCMEE 5410]